MATKKKTPTIIEKEGYRFEWTVSRGEMAVDIYAPDGVCVAELGYPVTGGIGFSDFMGEALHIAKRNDAKRQTEG